MSLSYLSPAQAFEGAYLEVREKEQRVLLDDEVKLLPVLPPSHPHAREWEFRVKTCQRFRSYLQSRDFGQVLDLGCGNGWFTHWMHQSKAAHYWGVDINAPELEQALRVFGSTEIQFAYGDIFEDIFPDQRFDAIVLNASVQYFPDLKALLDRLQGLLEPKGEIHLLDSPFYPASEIAAAKARTQAYYQQAGVPAMADYYHHHQISSVESLGGTCLYRPKSYKKWLGIKDSPLFGGGFRKTRR